jgi:two-component system, cell cycle sensor histidine kinase and response regulator CckA
MPDTTITILVVDSDHANRASMAQTLRANGYRVLEAKGFQDADNMYQLHAGAINLLITAISLPERNGYELAKRLTAAAPRIKVMFVSGVTGALLSKFYGRDPDNQATLFRPFEPDDLLLRVKQLLSQMMDSRAAGA